jgi:hypothetical protein
MRMPSAFQHTITTARRRLSVTASSLPPRKRNGSRAARLSSLPGLIDRHCSPVAYTSAVEAACRAMWENYCGGPQHQSE